MGEISFPHLGISIENLPSGFSVFGFRIAYYGVIIAVAFVVGYYLVDRMVKKTKQSSELYLDFAMIVIVMSIIGARLYYVLFEWDYYKENPLQIFNTRGGGLAIYGGVIAAMLTSVVYAKRKKISVGLLMDTACVGLVIGQAIGRWGNFFNREAFGMYTDGLFAMRIPWDTAVSHMSAESAQKLLPYVSDSMIQVHPTFLYESMWNLILFFFLWNYTFHKKFNGEVMCLYLAGYGIGRIWIESLRTDQLLLWDTGIPVSQLLSGIMVIASFWIITFQRLRLKKKRKMEQSIE
ncbi:MAG: prolipoprotein diacylglyceryl transferase [Clostridiales bacterium]|nr:prolipoprotein diacylglyceryl transferase [Clostridiales bacterium]